MPAMNRIRWTLFALLALLLAACGGMPHKKVDMVAEYGNAVRWSDWDTAWNYIDPATRKTTSLPEEERDRLKDTKVTGYDVRTTSPQPDGTARQLVEIRYIDQATQVEKTYRDVQIWRTDDNGEHWWLTTGLPTF
jgi:hypothetical protein